MTTQRVGWSLAAVAACAIAGLTLVPVASPAELPRWCFQCGALWFADWLLNVALFLPFGLGVSMAAGVRNAVLGSVGLTLAIELLQDTVIPGRYPSTGDLLLNALGGTIGALLGRYARGLLRPGRRRATRLAAAASTAWLAIVTAVGWSFAPSISPYPLWGQWAPDLAHLERFRGRVLRAGIGGIPFPSTLASDSPRLRRLLVDSASAFVTATLASPTAGVAPIVSIFDATQHEMILLGQDGLDAVFRARTRAADIGLRSPEAVLRNAFRSVTPGSEVTVHADRRGTRVHLRTAAPASRVRETTIGFGPHSGWMLLLAPTDVGPSIRWIATAFAIGILLVPAAYWTGCTGSRRAGPALLTGLIIAGLALVPTAQDASIAPLHAWGGTLFCAAAAIAAGRRYGVDAGGRA